MPEEPQTSKNPPPKGGKGGKGKSVGGLPQWALLPMVIAVGVIGIVWFRNHKGAKAGAASAGVPQTPSTLYASGLASDQASALFSQLQNLQGQMSNAFTQTAPGPGKPTFLPWAATDYYPLSLNELATITNTTAQAIIDATMPSMTPDSSAADRLTQQYLDTGDFDAPIPGGAGVWIPETSTSAGVNNLPTYYTKPGGGAAHPMPWEMA